MAVPVEAGSTGTTASSAPAEIASPPTADITAAVEGPRKGYNPDLERIEIQLLLEGVYRHYGFDFRAYAYASLRRRIWKRIDTEQLSSISALQDRVLHDPSLMEKLLLDLSINVTAMFRDPAFYVAFRRDVVPALRTYPFIRIWHAGCSTGEEAYSMAILLEEEDLYDRARLYATDINEVVIQKAKEGIFPLDRMQEYTQNYLRAGGTRSFSEYYTAMYDGALFAPRLMRNIVFSQHNLVTDRSFAECNVILCRNVLIYFDRTLQQRVHKLFYESLPMYGYLGLGSKESLRFTGFEDNYEQVDRREKIYRKIK
jgi:chemotaxis protein methyltransferase CheR